jgi:GNAT superfamily N-acetyltransferase
MEIRRLDPLDATAMADWHATYAAAARHGLAYTSPWALEEVRAKLLDQGPGQRMEGLSGRVDGEHVCAGLTMYTLMDNRDTAFIEVSTRPDRQRAGHGTRMLAALLDRAREEGRSQVLAEAMTPYDAVPSGAGHPNADFLLHRGFSFGLGNVMRVLDLPLDEDLLAGLAAEAAPHHTAYTLVQWKDRVPDELLDQFADLIGTLITEAPMGDIELEREVYDEARIRADEETMRAAGRTKYCTVAMTTGREMVAYSEIGVPSYDSTRLYQWGTLVRPAHRGHRLGMATKAANLRFIQAEVTGRELLVSYNAESNGPMVAVNEAMGFRAVQRLGEYALGPL